MSFMFDKKKRKSSSRDEEEKPKMEHENYSGYPPLHDDLSDEIDKIHFIVGHGIIRPQLRYYTLGPEYFNPDKYSSKI